MVIVPEAIFLQDLHGLQRFYHNVVLWGIKLYHYTNFLELSLVRYGNACLRLFVVILQDLHCLQSCYHNCCCMLVY